jgi:hypothetical protein
MSVTNLEIVRNFNLLCEARRFEEAAEYLHRDYTLRDPQFSYNSPEEFVEGMKSCTGSGKFENVEMAELGPDKVIQVLDCVMTKPVHFTLRMCNLLTLQDGKIIAEEAFYDLNQIPAEARAPEEAIPVDDLEARTLASRLT